MAKYHLANTDRYDLLQWNCETFATYSLTGRKESKQVKAALEMANKSSFRPVFQGSSSSLPIPEFETVFDRMKVLTDNFYSWLHSLQTGEKSNDNSF
jgi:hypothetical protein